MRSGRNILAATLAAATQLFACSGSSTPAPPTTAPAPPTEAAPPGSQPINGTERIGWDQPADDATELATLSFAIYVDGQRTIAGAIACGGVATSAGFACSAALPQMTPGLHKLTIAAFTDAAEGPQSPPFLVFLTSAAVKGLVAAPTAPVTSTVDGAPLRINVVAGQVDRPSDLTALPDGRLLVADRSGIRVIADGQLAAEPAYVAGQEEVLLALAADADYSRSHLVYVAGVAPARSGEPTFWLARFREVGNRLGERAMLLDGVPASPTGMSASLRMGADGNLYAAIDDGGNARAAGDLASFSGKVLRLKTDGTTPRDQTPPVPVYVAGVHSPRGLDWDPAGGSLWLADAQPSAQAARLNHVAETRTSTARSAAIDRSYALSAQAMPSAMAFYRGTAIPQLAGNLLVASETDRGLLRVQFDSTDRTRVRSAAPLLADAIAGARAVAVAHDGRLYIATTDAVFSVSGF